MDQVSDTILSHVSPIQTYSPYKGDNITLLTLQMKSLMPPETKFPGEIIDASGNQVPWGNHTGLTSATHFNYFFSCLAGIICLEMY